MSARAMMMSDEDLLERLGPWVLSGGEGLFDELARRLRAARERVAELEGPDGEGEAG